MILENEMLLRIAEPHLLQSFHYTQYSFNVAEIIFYSSQLENSRFSHFAYFPF